MANKITMNKNKTVNKLNRLEKKPAINVRLHSKNNKKWGNGCRLLVALLGIVALCIFVVFTYFIIQFKQEYISDKRKFNVLRETVVAVRSRLSQMKTIKWESPSSNCEFGVTVGLQSGSWGCETLVMIEATQVFPNDVESIINDYNNRLKHSTDILEFKKSEPSKRASSEQFYKSLYKEKQTDVTCELAFTVDKSELNNNEATLRGGFSCSDSAQKSWYRSDNKYEGVEDYDAWKN